MNRQNRFLRLRTFRFQALGAAVAALSLSACAQKLEPHTQAWGLIDATELTEATSKKQKPAASAASSKRQATWLDPYAQGDYYEQSPAGKAVARRSVALDPSAPQSNARPLASRSMDALDPRGWTRSDLVERWGTPKRVQEDRWIYEKSDDAGRCTERKSLRLVDGVVSAVKSDRCS